MIVVQDRNCLVIPTPDPTAILTTIPTAKSFTRGPHQFAVVPHKRDEVRVLRNLGFKAPSPIVYQYNWPGRFSPFPAQLDTAGFASMYDRAYILNGLGSGKTQATLWAYDYLRSLGMVKRMIVVAPLSTLERVWGDAVFQHFPHLQHVVLHGTRDKRLKLLEQKADVYIVNHAGIKILSTALSTREDIDLVVIDELSQAARNSNTDTWEHLNWVVNGQAATKRITEPMLGRDGVQVRDSQGAPRVRVKTVSLGKDGPKRKAWGLTGTPTPNELSDAWAQCRLLTPWTVPPYFSKFREKVMRKVTEHRYVEREGGLAIVREVMQPAIRYSRDECVGLPPTTHVTRTVDLTPKQQALYTSMLRQFAVELDEGKITAANEGVKLLKLLQIVCGTVFTEDRDVVVLPSEPRLAETLEIVRESESKSIVFVPFVPTTALVSGYLEQHGVKCAVIHGGVPKAARDQIYADFQNAKDPRVIVAQPAAMSHGLTLTAASTIVWYAPINSSDTCEQANGRITRPGQSLNTLIVNIEASPLERHMYSRLKNKQHMQSLLLDLIRSDRLT